MIQHCVEPDCCNYETYNAKYMKRSEFIKRVNDAINRYLDDFELYEPNPQLSVNPDSLYVDIISGKDMFTEIENSDEALENAAGAQGAATEQDFDYQVSQNPDFYPIRRLLKISDEKPTVADSVAIEALANNYFK